MNNNFIKEIDKDTSITLVVGPAGSGKTTYTRANADQYDQALYHDEWVELSYRHPMAVIGVSHLFPTSPHNEYGYEKINKDIVKQCLRENPTLNPILINFFKTKFSIMMSRLYRQRVGDIIIECPFLDENIRALKETYGDKFKVVCMKTQRADIIGRLIDRGWDDERMKMSLGFQFKEFKTNKDLIDEFV